MKRIIKIIPPILWVAFIFYLSSKPSSFFVGATEAKDMAAHIFLYAVLSFLIIRVIADRRKNLPFRYVFLFPVFFSILYGVSDEYHQSFVPGREASIGDLAVDSLGAVLGAAVFFGFFRRRTSRGDIRRLGMRGDQKNMPKFLLHVCCIGCGAYVMKLLKKDYNVTLYFYNPNIWPEDEYERRLEESRRIAEKFDLPLIVGEYEYDKWRELVKGHEADQERGERCFICYRARLEAAAKVARNKNFGYFASTLSISPHKDAEAINRIGNELAAMYGVRFLDRDFKKDDGFRKSCLLSKELGLYRQNYCGCEFSIRK